VLVKLEFVAPRVSYWLGPNLLFDLCLVLYLVTQHPEVGCLFPIRLRRLSECCEVW
jgi:hypothetical protein